VNAPADSSIGIGRLPAKNEAKSWLEDGPADKILVGLFMHYVLRFMVKTVPVLTELLTSTLPPIFSMIFLQILKPSPVPPLF